MEENPQSQKVPEDYWGALVRTPKVPNFWMTREYADLAELEWVQEGSLWGWREPGEPGWFLPPLGPDGIQVNAPCWAGFADMPVSSPLEILDRQYIYDARNFLDLEGSHWKVYRKNIRKYPNRTDWEELLYRPIEEHCYTAEIGEMLAKWAEDKGDSIKDPQTMTMFFLFGSLRWGLFKDGELVGVNVGDENHRHAIYRYCLDDGTPFLNEYLRHLFYTWPWVQEKRWVNDGGDLGNENLRRFKRKLNPVTIQTIYTTPSI